MGGAEAWQDLRRLHGRPARAEEPDRGGQGQPAVGARHPRRRPCQPGVSRQQRLQGQPWKDHPRHLPDRPPDVLRHAQGDHKKRAKYRFASKTLMRILPSSVKGEIEGLIEKKAISLDLYEILGKCTWKPV